MRETTDSFKTADGLTIQTISWLPDGEMKAAVMVTHGIFEYSGRYRHFAEFLTAHGYGIYSHDHRGHGKSEGMRVYFDTFMQPLDDLKVYLDRVKAALNGKKLFLFGHSMGAAIALDFALRNQESFTGLILSGTPATFDQRIPAPIVGLANVLNRFAPTMPLFPLSLKYISRDPAVVAAYVADPLVFRMPIRVRVGLELRHMVMHSRTHLSELRLPLLVLHGAEDKIVHPSGSDLVYNQASSADKTLKIYPGLYHEILNEPEQKMVMDDIGAWLDKH